MVVIAVTLICTFLANKNTTFNRTEHFVRNLMCLDHRKQNFRKEAPNI